MLLRAPVLACLPFPSTHPRRQGELGCVSLAPVPGLAAVAASLGRGPAGAGGDRSPGTPVNGAEDVTSLASRSQDSHGRRRRVSFTACPTSLGDTFYLLPSLFQTFL